ncbi:MAG: UvrD-helicase domain-containing protein [Candidatus Omnitrophota bacterium]
MDRIDTQKTNRPPQFPEVCVVEASAGSGKTYELATRYLRLLFDPSLQDRNICLKHILAITFTNKACLEMKARILLFLKQLALDQFEDDKDKANLLSKLKCDEALARKKAHLVMDEIIRRYNYFQVQTIDSFINAILSGCAFKLDLSSDFRIKNDFREYLVFSFDEMIENANEDPKVKERFHQFLQNYLYLEQKRSWFPKNDIIEIMGLLLNARNSYGLEFKRSGKDLKAIRDKRRRILERMLKIRGDFPEGANGTYWRKFENDFNDAVPLNSIDDFFNPFSKEEFPAKKNAQIPGGTANLWRQVKSDIGQLYEWEAFSRFNPYIDIFQGVEENFKIVCREDDIMFLAELNAKAQDLFTFGSISVPELYYRLATQFRHFLIDEFQDTSILQWKNLFPMVEEALATGGSLFYVGDKKQAIFRWRGGEVALMDYLKRQLSAFNVNSTPLTRNFRSQKEVVEFNNTIFSSDNINRVLGQVKESKKSFIDLSEEDTADIRGIFSNSRQTFKEKYSRGYVEVNSIDRADSDDANSLIKEEVYARIERLTGRFRPKDIAILCRSNNDVERVTSWLLERKLPCESEKTLNIRENSIVKELAAFLTFLNSPIDDLAFATFVMGEIFTKASGISNEKIRGFLFEAGARYRHKSKPYLYRSFKNEFPQAWEGLVEEFFKTVGFVPLYELVISILRKFGVLDRFPQAQGFVMKFLEVVKEREDDYQNIARFLEYFNNELPENLFVHVASSDSIRVLTIHKSKGLEFPAVIIPFFEVNIRIGGGQNTNASFVIDARDENLGLTSLNKERTKYSPDLEQRYRLEYKKALIDELNNLYVASTRAQHELYIFVSEKIGKEFNIASLLIPEDMRTRGSTASYKPKAEKKETETVLLGASKYRDWIGFLKDEFEGISSVKDYERIAHGNALHGVLARIGNLAGKDPQTAVTAALDRAKLDYQYFTDWGSVEKTLRRLVAHPKARDLFAVPGGDVYAEREMVDPSGNTRRADRLIVRDNEVIVIDYKSGKTGEDQYAAQIREYARILRSIYPERSIKAFLVYCDDIIVEEVKCGA